MKQESEFLLPQSEAPEWFAYPKGLVELIRGGRKDLTPWHLMGISRVRKAIPALQDRFGRQVVPFAYRQNNDDIAVFEKGFGEKVVVIHDFADMGSETEEEYPDFAAWLSAVEEEAKEWES